MSEYNRKPINNLINQVGLILTEISGGVVAFQNTVSVAYSELLGAEIAPTDLRIAKIGAGLVAFGLAGLAFNQTTLD